MTNLDSILKNRDITLLTKVHMKNSYGFLSSHVCMCELDHREGWVPKNWCFWTVMLEKMLENLLDSKEIKPVNPEGNQHWIFTGRTDAEAPIFWPLDMKSWLTVKDPDAGKDWGQEEMVATEDGRLDGTIDSISFCKLWVIVEDRGDWLAGVHGV